MNIHAILAVKDTELMEKRIKDNFSDSHYEFDDGQWFIAADLTTKQVADTLGVYDDEMRCIIIPVTNYNGLHNADTWEWLELKRAQ